MAHIPHPTKGKDWWYIILREKGSRKQHYIPFRGSKAEVTAMDMDLQGRTANTTYPSVNDLLPRFLPAYQNNSAATTYQDMLNAMKRLLPYFGQMRVPLILPYHYEEYKTKRLADTYLPGRPAQMPEDDTPADAARRKTVGKRTINRELTYLKALLTFAEEQGTTVSHRPKLFPKKQAAPKAIIVLSPEEIGAVLDQLQGDQRTLASLMFWAGLRKSESQHLRVRDVDLANNSLIVHGKGNKIRIVPILDAELAQDLDHRVQKLKGQPTDAWLIANPQTGKPYTSIMKALRTACTKAGVSKHVYHHLLRHTFGTSAMVSGMHSRSIQGMMGHADSRTTEMYTHLAAQFLQSEGAKLTGLVAKKRRAKARP